MYRFKNFYTYPREGHWNSDGSARNWNFPVEGIGGRGGKGGGGGEECKKNAWASGDGGGERE